MAKDGNNGRKDEQENSSNGRSHKCNKHRPPIKASKAILKVGPPPTSQRTTSVKLEDTMGNEVKESLNNRQDGNDERILIDMLVKSIAICNKYLFYNANDDSQCVVQVLSRTLTGECEKEHDRLLNNTNN